MLKFIVWSTDQQRTASPGGHALTRIVNWLEHQSKGSLQLATGLLHQFSECEVFSVITAVVDVSHQLGDHLGVSLRLKANSSLTQEDLDVLVVGDNAIVHHQELVVRITAVRMTVDITGCSMGGPPGMSNTYEVKL